MAFDALYCLSLYICQPPAVRWLKGPQLHIRNTHYEILIFFFRPFHMWMPLSGLAPVLNWYCSRLFFCPKTTKYSNIHIKYLIDGAWVSLQEIQNRAKNCHKEKREQDLTVVNRPSLHLGWVWLEMGSTAVRTHCSQWANQSLPFLQKETGNNVLWITVRKNETEKW